MNESFVKKKNNRVLYCVSDDFYKAFDDVSIECSYTGARKQDTDTS